MSVDVLNPKGLPEPEFYRQVAVASGSRIVFVAGQVARDEAGRPVGAGDLTAQTERVFLNLAVALSAAGASFRDVAKLTAYVVDWTPDKIQFLGAGVGLASQQAEIDMARPITLLGVAALAEPDLLIEVEAVAVLP